MATARSTRVKGPDVATEKHIRLGKDGKYWVEIDRLKPDGSRFRKASAYTKLDKAISTRDEWLAILEANDDAPQKLSFDDWATECFDNIFPHPHGSKRGLKARTIHGYKLLYDLHASPVLGRMDLRSVKPEHVMNLIHKGMTGRDADTKGNMRTVLSKLYSVAQAWGKVPVGYNPCKVVTVPRGGREFDGEGYEIHTARNLTIDEQTAFLAKAQEISPWAYLGYLIGFKMGLRTGEILGFNLQHVDWKQKIYEVNGQAIRVVGDDVRYTDSLKKDGSYRKVPIPASVMAELERFKAEHPFWKFVCTDDGKRFWRPESFAKQFVAIAEAAELTKCKDSTGAPLKDPTPHDMRHSFGYYHANVLGTPHSTLMKLMGHKQITTTLGYYAKAGNDDLIAAMAAIA